jgi:hypothetical protein
MQNVTRPQSKHARTFVPTHFLRLFSCNSQTVNSAIYSLPAPVDSAICSLPAQADSAICRLPAPNFTQNGQCGADTKVRLSLSRVSQNSRLLNNFLQRTPAPNFMKIRQINRRHYVTEAGGRVSIQGVLSCGVKNSHRVST